MVTVNSHKLALSLSHGKLSGSCSKLRRVTGSMPKTRDPPSVHPNCEKVSSQSTHARLGHYRSIAAATNGPTPKVPEHHHDPHSVPLRHRQRSHAASARLLRPLRRLAADRASHGFRVHLHGRSPWASRGGATRPVGGRSCPDRARTPQRTASPHVCTHAAHAAMCT